MSAASAIRAIRSRVDEASTRRIAGLFMIGSACFAVASLPGASSVTPEVVGVTYFVGSLFFTTAALEQLRTVERHNRLDLSASMIQFAGTLLFNVNTFDGMLDGLSAHQEDLLVLVPDAIGCACFLAASGIALAGVLRAPLFAPARRIARLNMIGSLAFGAAALAAWVIPDTDSFVDASLATSGTLVGGICFFYGAFILRRHSHDLAHSTAPAPA
ncbi:MAG: hypothetical protein EXQ70_08685 [Solirubrobacterales bacterium]|nr:hypothetical protein [Solirubrobacterales bacterium]